MNYCHGTIIPSCPKNKVHHWLTNFSEISIEILTFSFDTIQGAVCKIFTILPIPECVGGYWNRQFTISLISFWHLHNITCLLTPLLNAGYTKSDIIWHMIGVIKMILISFFKIWENIADKLRLYSIWILWWHKSWCSAKSTLAQMALRIEQHSGNKMFKVLL